MARKLSADAADALKKREAKNGLADLVAYADEAGIWTIGYGHTGPEVTKGLVWTLQQCDDAFVRDTEAFCACVETHVKVPLNDNEFGALVSFCYNIGIGNFVDHFSGLKSLNDGDYATIPAHMLLWNKITDPVTRELRVSNGLINRRNSEGGQWVQGGYVPSTSIIAVPEPPPPWYKTQRAKTLAAQATGTSATGVLVVAAQAKTLADTWHPFIIVFIVLSACAIGLGVYQTFKNSKEGSAQ